MIPFRLGQIGKVLPAVFVAFEGDLGRFGGGAADGEEAAFGNLDFEEEDEVGEEVGLAAEEVFLVDLLEQAEVKDTMFDVMLTRFG